MGGIIDKITDFIKEMLQGWVLSNLDTMFSDVNDKVGTIAGEVSKTPSTWNSGIFSMIRTLSENVVVPIAGMPDSVNRTMLQRFMQKNRCTRPLLDKKSKSPM